MPERLVWDCECVVPRTSRRYERVSVVVQSCELAAGHPGPVHKLELPSEVGVEADEVQTSFPTVIDRWPAGAGGIELERGPVLTAPPQDPMAFDESDRLVRSGRGVE